MTTKRQLLDHQLCPKLAWLREHSPQEALRGGAPEEQLLREGQSVSARARKEFPQGLLIEAQAEGAEARRQATTAALGDGDRPLFEAEFILKDLVVRTDVLVPGRAGWRLISVKPVVSTGGETPSTSKLPTFDRELAIQRFVLEQNGVTVESVELMLLNQKHRHPDQGPLFHSFDRSESTAALLPWVEAEWKAARDTLAEPAEPDIAVGPHCKQQRRDCAFFSYCKRQQGQDVAGSILDLYWGGTRAFVALAEGRTRLLDLDEEGDRLNPTQSRQLEAERQGRRVVQREALRDALAAFAPPAVHLDFESINFALPRYEGTGPWEHLPFQYSIHIEHAEDQDAEHLEFLAEPNAPPHLQVAEALAEVLRRCPDGPVVAWYRKFEDEQLRVLERFAPQHAEVFRSARERLVDPLPVTRSHVADPALRGSFSLKAVAPALLGEEASYAGMDIGDGGEAIAAWVELTTTDDPARRATIRQNLLTYCKQDTEVMLGVVRALRRLAAGQD